MRDEIERRKNVKLIAKTKGKKKKNPSRRHLTDVVSERGAPQSVCVIEESLRKTARQRRESSSNDQTPLWSVT